MGDRKEQYKLIIFGNGVYQEVVLADKYENGVIIGTTSESKIRFDKEDFFCEFQIDIDNQNGWALHCNRDIYIDSDSIIRVYSKRLMPQDELIFRYSDSDAEFLHLAFVYDFDNIPTDYARVVSVAETPNLCIGGQEFCRIQLAGERVGSDFLTLTLNKDAFVVNVNQATYGVSLNGMEQRETVFTLNNYDFLMFDGYKFYYKDLKLYMDSKDETIIPRMHQEMLYDSGSALTYPKFVKNVRLRNTIEDDKIRVLPPETKKEVEKENLLVTLMPSLITFAFMMVLRTQMSNNAMMAIYMGGMMLVGIITSIFTHFRQKKKNKRDEEKRVRNYTAYIKEKEKEIQKAREKELDDRRSIFIDINEEVEEVNRFDYHLFEKEMEDEDFLTLRLGTGSVEAKRELMIKEKEEIKTDDPLEDYPQLLKDSYDRIEDAPITIDLKQNGVVGVVGRKEGLYDLLKILTIEIAVRHFYKSIELYYIFDQEDQGRFSSIRWLRNVYHSEQSSIRNFVYDQEGRKALFERLFKELSEREAFGDAVTALKPYIVVFISDSKGFRSHPLSNYLNKAESLKVVFIFFEEHRELIPSETKKLIRVGQDIGANQGSGCIIDAFDQNRREDFVYHSISDEVLEEVSRRIGCVYIESVNLEGTLTKNISLFRLLDIISVNDLDLAKRWATSEVYKSMAAPIGVRTENQIVSLDLHEKAHGPHGLVAGTTGSGKSEILQTYILSMATLFSPLDVSFVIIDFKGGGMANQFKNLPHLIGTITNIDGEAIDRSLASIHAELKKRQTYFKEANVNHIDAYIKLYKQGKAKEPLPHLILIVDEFAELKSDQPEFMQELISTARIGRSLGVHLILATQKPAGVVNDQIWSNSKFKLCLKVQNKNDSNEVLHSPLAAEIREPGRAYLQVGNNEIFELFQSAYSGSSVDSEKSGMVNEYSIHELDLMGRGRTVFEQKNERKKDSLTQLDALVSYIADYYEKAGIPRLQGICLPELPVRMTEEEAQQAPEKSRTEEGIVADIGIYDDPDHQEQNMLTVHLSKGHTLIIGSPQFGKTNVLQQMMKQLIARYTPADVNVYILDFASMSLRTFQDSLMVGGVVTASEDDKMNHFIKLMQDEIMRRKDLLSASELSSFEAYREAGKRDLPQIVVLIDNFMGLKEMYLQKEDFLLPLLREGATYGITFVVADIQSSSLGFRYMSLFSNRIALYCNNDSEYASVFGYCRKKLKNIPGRGIVEIDKQCYFFQTFLAFAGEREFERVAKMKQLVTDSNQTFTGYAAKRIPEVPDRFTPELLERLKAEGMPVAPYSPVFGIGFESAAPEAAPFGQGGILAITGGADDVKVRWLNNLMLQLLYDPAHPAEITIFDDYRGMFGDLETWFKDNGLNRYHRLERFTDTDNLVNVFNDLSEYGKTKQEELKSNPKLIAELPLKLMLIQNKEVIDKINGDRTLLEVYKTVISKYRMFRLMFVFSDFENVKLPFTGVDVQKSILENRNLMLLENINKIRVMDIPPNAQRQFAKALTKTEGISYKEGVFEKYKLLV